MPYSVQDKKSVLVYTCDDNCGSAKKIECGEGKVCGLDENGIGACVMGGEEEELECDPKEPTLLRRSTKPISKLLKIGDEREFCGNEEINVKEDWKDSVEGSYYQKRIITKNVNGVDVLYKQIRRKGEETILGRSCERFIVPLTGTGSFFDYSNSKYRGLWSETSSVNTLKSFMIISLLVKA